MEWQPYSRAGQPLPQVELYVVDKEGGSRVRIDLGDGGEPYLHIIGWHPDGIELYLLRMNRLMNRLDLLAVNPGSGSTRNILTERSDTFIVGLPFLHGYSGWLEWINHVVFLDGGARFIWTSERDGWRRLYLYDLEGKLVRPLTSAGFEILRLEAIDEPGAWVYYSARGNPDRPYDLQLYRVSLGGGEPVLLLEGGLLGHPVFTGSMEYFWTVTEGLDHPHAVELYRADGTRLQTLWTADTRLLEELAWKPPEEFVVQAADGVTDLHGLLFKPSDFDPDGKYPVVEDIYAGPWIQHVWRSWQDPTVWVNQSLAELGFIVFKVDARGTPGRGKAFQDLVHGNFGRHEIPDHVAALKQLAAERPYMDLDRVGIFGHSWGGYFVLRALLLEPGTYHVGIASAPGVDLADFRVSVEPFMGCLPLDCPEAYKYGSNTRLAENLDGELLLIHGTSDDDAPFTETVKMIDALIQAGRPYDLIIFPEASHSLFRKPYWWDSIRRYLVEHLEAAGEMNTENGSFHPALETSTTR